MLAQQLADAAGGQGVRGEVIYLDLSTGARAVAEARAAARGLTNIRFVTGSLLDLGTLDLRSFDSLDCFRLLPTMPAPAAGLLAPPDRPAAAGGLAPLDYGTLASASG